MTDATLPLSQLLRERSRSDHDGAEHAPFTEQLMAGTLPRDAYTDLVAQHWLAYTVLERATEHWRGHPVGGAFVFDELTRVPSLEADLAFLWGDGWRERVVPNPGTRAYVARLEEVCFDWVGGYVAHQYTRYLGDLSGGQMIKRVVEQAYDLPDHQGALFYRFEGIPDRSGFFVRYRDALDSAPWDAAEHERILSEVKEAYRLNTEVLVDCGAAAALATG